jgi:NAD(P)-dependent dehydrogenase (short-subunit alcohol dehydrogenase family)
MSVAVVTGAANGIGRAVAERLVKDGFVVAGLDLEPVAGVPVAAAYRCDVAELEGHDVIVGRIEADLGPVTALANVAGIYVPQAIAELTSDAYRRQLAVMLDGPVWLARAVGLRMAARGGGRIVNVTSVHASNGATGALAYDVAKAGLEAATRSLAIELGPGGVLVNALAPGFVRTRMAMVDGRDVHASEEFRAVYLDRGKLPLRRPAEPADVAAAAGHLLSPANTYVTGHRLVVDGGLLATF